MNATIPANGVRADGFIGAIARPVYLPPHFGTKPLPLNRLHNVRLVFPALLRPVQP